MNTLARVLVVVIAVASIAFMGFAGVVTLGGPNWQAYADDIDGYTFSRSEGDDPQWSAIESRSGETVTTNKRLAEVIAAVLDRQAQQQQAELTELQEEEKRLDARIKFMKETIAPDEAALAARAEELRQTLQGFRNDYIEASNEVVKKSNQTAEIERQINLRRTDVFRLSSQLDEIKTDKARAADIRKQLEDLIQQLDGNINKADRRSEQLTERLE